jgi:hypothetical protein
LTKQIKNSTSKTNKRKSNLLVLRS